MNYNKSIQAKKCNALILAAGKSSRMGQQKFTLQYNDSYTFLEKILQEYLDFGCEEIVVVLNEKGIAILEESHLNQINNIKFVCNTHLEWERFYSIKLGIQNFKQKLPTFIQNVDNPFVNQKILTTLLTNISSDFIVPVYNSHGGHPILLSEHVITKLINEEKNDLVFSHFLKRFDKKILAVDDKKILININTTEEYKSLI